MNKNIARIIAVSGIAAVAALGLAACSTSSSTPDSSSSAEVGGNVVAPVTIDLATAAGKTFDIPMNSGGYIVTADGEKTRWGATFSKDGVVTFTDGTVAGSSPDDLVTAPFLTPVAVGTTEVTLSNGSTGTSVTFTVNVTA